MPYLTLNEIDFDVVPGERETSIIGARRRMFDGSYKQTVRASKESYTTQTGLLSRDDADAFYDLLMGYGSNWRFAAASDYYSGKGGALGVETLGGGTITAGGASGKFDKRITFSSATPYLSFTPTGDDALTGNYTIAVWKLTSTGPDVWTHYAATWDGSALTEYTNGVAGAAAMNFISVTSGVLRLNNSEATSNWAYSDLLAFPFVMPATWIAAIAAATRQFPNRPNVEVSGDMVNRAVSDPLTCCPVVEGFVPVPQANALDGGRVVFRLEEV